MIGGGLGSLWFVEGYHDARQQLQAYIQCDGPNHTACNVHVPLSVDLALNVTVTDKSGKVVGSVYQPHDLILNNFYLWLTALLNNAQSGQTVTVSPKNTAGGAVTSYGWGVFFSGSGTSNCSVAGSGFNCFNSVSAGEGGLIEVGTLSTAATRADTNLGAAYQSYFDTNAVCSTGSTDSIVVTGSENANTGTTVTESGLFYQSNAAGPTTETYMLAHDVFTGVAVSAGNTVTVQYTWSLNNAGYNYNLCEYFAGMLTQPNGANNIIKPPNSLMVFYDTSGRNVTWAQQCSVSSGYTGFLMALSNPNPNSPSCTSLGTYSTNAMQVAIGTGGASFTPTTRSLTSFYAQNYITSVSYDSAGNAYETANILLATGATISEAAIYLTLPAGCVGYSPNHGGSGGACITAYTSDTIMLLAATFTGQAVPNGQSIGITFQESG